MESKKYNELVHIMKKKQTHRHREPTSGYQWGERWEGGAIQVEGNKRYKVLGIK